MLAFFLSEIWTKQKKANITLKFNSALKVANGAAKLPCSVAEKLSILQKENQLIIAGWFTMNDKNSIRATYWHTSVSINRIETRSIKNHHFCSDHVANMYCFIWKRLQKPITIVTEACVGIRGAWCFFTAYTWWWQDNLDPYEKTHPYLIMTERGYCKRFIWKDAKYEKQNILISSWCQQREPMQKETKKTIKQVKALFSY